MNTQELNQIRSQFLSMANRDVNQKMTEFMTVNHMNERQVASALGLTESDVDTILHHADRMTMKQFASILIASGNVIAIQPIEMTPLAGQFGASPTIDIKREKKTNRAASAPTPVRDSNGRFARRAPMPPVPPMFTPIDGKFEGGMPQQFEDDAPQEFGGVQNLNLDSMTRKELVTVVRENGWDGEIDLDEADRTQIIAFLEHKSNETKDDEKMAPSDALRFIQSFIAQHPEVAGQLKF